MGRYVNVELEDAVETKNIEAVQHYTDTFKAEVLEQWFDKEHETMEKLLRVATQRAARVKRKLKKEVPEWELSYLLGCYEAYGELFYTLYRKEEEDKDLIRRVAGQSTVIVEILQCLLDAGDGLRHGELAKRLEMSESALTNNMKRIAQLRAVEISRSGKNTFYSLTDAGRRYCKQERERQIQALKETQCEGVQRYNLILKMTSELMRPSIGLGDTIKIRKPMEKGEHQLIELLSGEKIYQAQFRQINLTSALEPISTTDRVKEKIDEFITNSYKKDDYPSGCQPVAVQV